jgi:hypothetical protein
LTLETPLVSFPEGLAEAYLKGIGFRGAGLTQQPTAFLERIEPTPQSAQAGSVHLHGAAAMSPVPGKGAF